MAAAGICLYIGAGIWVYVYSCRPDVANKLFPLIHEKRIQGVAIERLRYRWAATNPPPDAQASDDDGRYDGVEPLDPTLADRLAFIVWLPRFDDL
jgi:MoxR-like ATPase